MWAAHTSHALSGQTMTGMQRHRAATSRKAAVPHARGGFTLVEILTVIFIIITLLALLSGAVISAERYSKKAAIQACLGNISTAIESYYSDFSTYPVSDPNAADTPNCSYGGSVGSGSAGLAEALMGYLVSTKDGAGPDIGDSAYGFRMTAAAGKGRIYGPYMQATATNYSALSTADQYFIDPTGWRILYYRSSRPTITAGTTKYFASTGAIFNDADNSIFLNVLTNYTSPPPAANPVNTPSTSTAFLNLLGDSNGNNTVDTGELPINTGTFLLVSPGVDGNYFDGNNIVNTK